MRMAHLLLTCVLVWPLAAQVDRATLVGAVTDPTGAVVPNAKVEVFLPDTGLRRQVETNAAGAYTVPSLPIGIYTVTVSLSGFKTVTIRDVRLGVGTPGRSTYSSR